MIHQPFSLEQIAIDFQPQKNQLRPFVFVHGNTQNDTCGTGIKSFFARKGHSVFSYDLPGHGDSSLESENYTFEDLITLNIALLQEYRLNNPILCGHSLGGMIQAATIARLQLTSASLILCGSYDANPIVAAKSQSQLEESRAIDAALTQYIEEGYRLFKRQKKYDYFANRQNDDEIVGIINRRYTQPKANQWNLSTMDHFSVRKTLSELDIPILVLHGKNEDVIPASLIETMLPAYRNIRIGWYANAAHYAFYQMPDLTDKYLAQYYTFLCE